MPELIPVVERVPLASLKPHPRNYRQHPPDQLEHIKASIREHGVYRNIVVAEEYTILAGHGVVKALLDMQETDAPVVRLPISPDCPQALKLLAGDNEIGHLAMVDDRMFTELLKEVKDLDNLLGTGYDDLMLANLIYVTRPESEIKDRDEAAEWAGAGMPDYDNPEVPFKLIISFRTEADRVAFVEQTHLKIDKTETKTWMTRWPYTDRMDLRSIRFEQEAAV